ncbi:MAG: hypothetical protein IPL32_00015 [Chloracidobacterium sp.]|nr:hypothetical protein [Chloracidobacterium sp.]
MKIRTLIHYAVIVLLLQSFILPLIYLRRTSPKPTYMRLFARKRMKTQDNEHASLFQRRLRAAANGSPNYTNAAKWAMREMLSWDLITLLLSRLSSDIRVGHRAYYRPI